MSESDQSAKAAADDTGATPQKMLPMADPGAPGATGGSADKSGSKKFRPVDWLRTQWSRFIARDDRGDAGLASPPAQKAPRTLPESLVRREERYREREENTWAAEVHASQLNLAWLLRARAAESDVKRAAAERVATTLVVGGVIVAFVAVWVCVQSWSAIVDLVCAMNAAITHGKSGASHVAVPAGFWQITVSLTASVLLVLAVSVQFFRAAREYRASAGRHSAEIDALRRVEAGLRLVLAAGSIDEDVAKQTLMKFGQTLIEHSAVSLGWKETRDPEPDVPAGGIAAVREVVTAVKEVATKGKES